MDSSIEVTLGSAPVRGGRGNQLQYTYYHTGEFNVTLTDTQWNLALLGSTVGDTQSVLYNYYKEETVKITSGSGTVSETPLAFEGTTIYGWATDPNGVTQKVTFDGKNFTVVDYEGRYINPNGSVDGDWCVRYYTENATAGNGITISANMIPKIVKLVMETQLNSADVTTNKIGIVQIIVPRLQLSGAFTISMTADGIANTPLTGTALAYSDAASRGCCVSEGYYAQIIEIIDNSNWYDNLIGLAVEGGDVEMEKSSTVELTIFAIPIQSTGAAFKIPNSEIRFERGAGPIFGIENGIITSGSVSGSAIVDMELKSEPSVDGQFIVTIV